MAKPANSQPSDSIAAAGLFPTFPPATTTATTTSIGVVGASGPLPTVWVTDQASISLFNRGPITSVFNPPASCVSTGTWGGGASLYFGHWVGFYYDSACYPGSTTDRVDAAWGQYYYSPAQCPPDWQTLKTFTSTFPGHDTTWLSLGSDTTVVLCCPSGYNYDEADNPGHACMSSALFTTTSLLYFSLYLNADNSWTHSNTPYITALTSFTIYGDGIPVWWQSSDLKLFPSASLRSSSFTATTQSSTSAPTQTTASGLSNSGKTGIEIGVPVAVVVILMVFLAFCIYFRRRKRHRVAQGVEDSAMKGESKGPVQVRELSNEGGLSELYSDRNQYHHHHHELPGS